MRGTVARRRRQWRFTHSTTENPPAQLATEEQRCPGRKIKRRRCKKSLKRGAKERERKGWKRRRKRCNGEGERIHFFCLFCHQLFKRYISPTTHLGMRVKVEESLLVSFLLNIFCRFLLFVPSFPFQPSSLYHSTPAAFLQTKLNTCCPAHLNVTSSVLFSV